jgi:hypothetical protein
LTELLRGIKRTTDRAELWDSIVERIARLVGGHCRVEAAVLSPDHNRLALAVEVKTLTEFHYRIDDLSDVSTLLRSELHQTKKQP